jgi:hypothetical protein
MPTSLLLAALLLDEPELVERILAVVNGRPVLLSEARVLAVVRGLPEDKARDALIDERLMFEQASRVPQAAVSSAEEEAAYRDLLERRPAIAEQVPETEMRRVVRREAVILKFLDLRFAPQVRISDDDLQAAYAEAYGGQPQAPTFESVAPALRGTLARRELDRRIEAWIAELRAAADIRVLP